MRLVRGGMALLAAMVVAATGCSGGNVRRGRIIFCSGNTIYEYKLKERADKVLAVISDADVGNLMSVGGVVGEKVVFGCWIDGRGPRIMTVPINGRQPETLSEGAFPTVLRDVHQVVYYRNLKGSDSLVLLVKQSLGGGEAESLGLVRPLRGEGGGSPWQYATAPVELDDGQVAVIGADGEIWTIDVNTRKWARLGYRGMAPEFWQKSERTLVCWGGAGEAGGASGD
jgi:hypothetical protein